MTTIHHTNKVCFKMFKNVELMSANCKMSSGSEKQYGKHEILIVKLTVCVSNSVNYLIHFIL